MKKLISLLLALSMALSLVACGASSDSNNADTTDTSTTAADTADTSTTPAEPAADGEQVELTVFAAASMTETLDEIAALYEAANPNVTLSFNYDSSGTLKTQIQEGADCDLFISAGQLQMNQLDAADTTGSNEEDLDFVLSDSRIDLLENKVTLCVPESNPQHLESFDDLPAAFQNGEILMAMGNEDVPVGQYTQKILAYYDLNEEELASAGMITYGTNVKEVTTQVSEGSVDCGVIYCTDAFSAGLEIVDYATAEMCGQVIYPAAVLNVSTHPDEAQAFLDYLQTEECTAIFEKVGFSAVE